MNFLLLYSPVLSIIPLFCSRDYKITIALKLRAQQQRDSYTESTAFCVWFVVLWFFWFFLIKFRPLNSYSFTILPHHLYLVNNQQWILYDIHMASSLAKLIADCPFP